MRFVRDLLAIGSLLFAGQALALFDAQVLYGPRWISTKTDGETVGSAYDSLTFAAHIDPIPFIPISFGVAYSQLNLKSRDKAIGQSSGKGTEIGLDVMAWIPFVPVITPYIRAYLPVVADYVDEYGAGASIEVDASGGHIISLGIQYSILPLVDLLLEGGKGVQMVEVTKCTPACIGSTGKTSYDVDTVKLGIQIGI